MKKMASLLLILAMTAALLSGCSSASPSPSGSTPSGGLLKVIKIASATPLSGSQAALGESIKNGIELAYKERIDEFKALGFDLQFSPQDDQADPKVGVSIAQRLIEDDAILAVVGHYNSGVAIPSSEVYNQGGLAMVSPANTGTDVTDRKLPTVSRICARDDAQGPAGADFLFNELGCKTVFIIQDKTTYGQGVSNEFQTRFLALGGKVLGYEGVTSGESDFSAVEELVRSTGAEAVYFGGIYPEGSLLIKQLAEKGIHVKFLGPDGMDSAEVISIAGEAAIGTYYTSVAADISNTETGAKFAAKYKETYSKNPEAFSAYGYDAMNVTLDAVAAAIKANNGTLPTREQVATAVRETKGFVGVATKVTLNDIGDNTEASVYILGFSKAAYPPDVISSIPVSEYLK